MSRSAFFARSLFVAAGVLCGLASCQHTATYPSVPTARGFTENPNTPACEQAVVASLQYVASRWTPGQREYDESETPRGLPMVPYDMVVNLPVGTRKMFYERIPASIGPNVKPATAESIASGLPVFHVGRVWLRFNTGTVDVYRPVTEVGPGADGQPVYQMISLKLERDFGTQWRVVYPRTWSPGDHAPPPIYYVPETDDPDQFAKSMRQQSGQIAKDPGLALPGEPWGTVDPVKGAPATALGDER
jgi:hypothetical protein